MNLNSEQLQILRHMLGIDRDDTPEASNLLNLAALAAPPVRAIDTELPARIARGGGTVWEARQVAGLMTWMARYERALVRIAAYGTGEAAMLAARVLVGDWDGCDAAA